MDNHIIFFDIQLESNFKDPKLLHCILKQYEDILENSLIYYKLKEVFVYEEQVSDNLLKVNNKLNEIIPLKNIEIDKDLKKNINNAFIQESSTEENNKIFTTVDDMIDYKEKDKVKKNTSKEDYDKTEAIDAKEGENKQSVLLDDMLNKEKIIGIDRIVNNEKENKKINDELLINKPIIEQMVKEDDMILKSNVGIGIEQPIIEKCIEESLVIEIANVIKEEPIIDKSIKEETRKEEDNKGEINIKDELKSKEQKTEKDDDESNFNEDKDESNEGESDKDDSDKDKSHSDESDKSDSHESDKDESDKDESDKNESDKDELEEDESDKDELDKDELDKDKLNEDESNKDEPSKDKFIHEGEIIEIINKDKHKSIKEKSIKDKQIKDKPIKEKSIKDKLLKDKQIKDKEIKDKPLKDKQLKDKPLIDKQLKDKPLKDKPIKDKPIKDKPIKDKPIKDKPLKDKPLKDKPLKDKPLKDKLLKDEPLKDKPLKDKPLKDEPLKDKLIKEKFIQNKSIRDKSIIKKTLPNKPLKDKPIKDKPMESKPYEDNLIKDKFSKDKQMNNKSMKEKKFKDKSLTDKPIKDKSSNNKLLKNKSIKPVTIDIPKTLCSKKSTIKDNIILPASQHIKELSIDNLQNDLPLNEDLIINKSFLHDHSDNDTNTKSSIKPSQSANNKKHNCKKIKPIHSFPMQNIAIKESVDINIIPSTSRAKTHMKSHSIEELSTKEKIIIETKQCTNPIQITQQQIIVNNIKDDFFERQKAFLIRKDDNKKKLAEEMSLLESIKNPIYVHKKTPINEAKEIVKNQLYNFNDMEQKRVEKIQLLQREQRRLEEEEILKYKKQVNRSIDYTQVNISEVCERLYKEDTIKRKKNAYALQDAFKPTFKPTLNCYINNGLQAKETDQKVSNNTQELYATEINEMMPHTFRKRLFKPEQKNEEHDTKP